MESREVALVTGGGGAIGAAIATSLGAAGYHVVINDIDEDRAESASQRLVDNGLSSSAVPGDITRPKVVDEIFSEVESVHGHVRALINSAGIGGDAAVRNITDKVWQQTNAVNLDAVLYCMRRALGPMRDRRSGTIVNVTSRAWLGWWGQGAYAASKAGVVGLTRALAVELASRGVTINAIAPGLIDTPLLRNEAPGVLERLLRSVPLGTLGEPRDVAECVSFLASDAARCITGQVLYVCGGKSVYAYPDWPDDA